MIQSLGYVTIAAGGTPVRATANLAVPSQRLGAQSITVQAHPSNAGVLYVGLSGLTKASGVAVLAVVPKPVSATTGPFAEVVIQLPATPNGLNAAEVYIDGTTNDIAVVRITQG